MHHLLLITLALESADTSLDARMSAHSQLLDDQSFCGEGGRFGAPLCDWFVVGGRWSGLLHYQPLGHSYKDAFEAQFPDLVAGSIDDRLIKQHRAALDRFWRHKRGRNRHPLTRTGYEELGYDDDAKLIDRALYDCFLKQYAGQDFGDSEFADLDGDAVDESFIGRKWLVVIDYHN